MCRPEKRSPSVDLEDSEGLESSAMLNKSDLNLAGSAKKAEAGGAAISRTGLKVLALLAIQNCVKNLVMRSAVSGGAKFLYLSLIHI